MSRSFEILRILSGAFDVPDHTEWDPVSSGIPNMTISDSSKLVVFAQLIFLANFFVLSSNFGCIVHIENRKITLSTNSSSDYHLLQVILNDLVPIQRWLIQNKRQLCNKKTQDALDILDAGLQAALPENLFAGLIDRKSTRLNSSHIQKSRMPSSA